jgi:TPR repeat protein
MLGANDLFSCAYLGFEKAIDSDDPQTIFQQAEAIYNDISTTNTEKLFSKLYFQAAELGHVGAQLKCAMLYKCGLGVQKSIDKSHRCYKLIADQGNANAQYKYGKLCEFNMIANRLEQFQKYYQLAADQGHIKAQVRLGVCCYDGFIMKQDFEKAAHCFKLAADQGHEDAQLRLAICYYFGNGVKKDEAIAIQWLKKSADGGHNMATDWLTDAMKCQMDEEPEYK